jgi:PadR family transcriptional regulator, regulatory protein PadR
LLSKLEVLRLSSRANLNSPATPVPNDRSELLQGTLDLLILKGLLSGPLHGWGLSKRIREISRDALQINQGSLYPALYRLEERGFVRSSWGVSSEGRRAKFYTLSAAGRKQFETEKDDWRRFALAIEQVLKST